MASAMPVGLPAVRTSNQTPGVKLYRREERTFPGFRFSVVGEVTQITDHADHLKPSVREAA